jgi:hypothetical protein
MTVSFEDIFHSDEPARDKYLSRLFALFNEQIVRLWCAREETPYTDLGRPTLYFSDPVRRYTLDFTFRKSNGTTYVGELKCELEYDGYRYVRLTDPQQLHHHTSKAFAAFLQAAKASASIPIRCGGQSQAIDGAILVWGAITAEGRQATMSAYGFADILSLETMVADLQAWADPSWADLLQSHRRWSDDLFVALGATG